MIPPYVARKVPNTREQMAESLMRMLMDGPEVSLSGSPTVSPTTAAAWMSLSSFLLMNWDLPSTGGSLFHLVPDSMYFLALSQAPPELEAEKAIWIPETMAPARIPLVAWYPKRYPMRSGETMTRAPGAIIFLREALVEMSMQASWS